MLVPLKNAHNASKFATKLGLACKWPNDPKVPIWIVEAYTCFKRVIAGNGDRVCWSPADSETFANKLVYLAGLVDEDAVSKAAAEMSTYFKGRSLEGYYAVNPNEEVIYRYIMTNRPDLREYAAGIPPIVFRFLRQTDSKSHDEDKDSLAKVATILGPDDFFQVMNLARAQIGDD